MRVSLSLNRQWLCSTNLTCNIVVWLYQFQLGKAPSPLATDTGWGLAEFGSLLISLINVSLIRLCLWRKCKIFRSPRENYTQSCAPTDTGTVAECGSLLISLAVMAWLESMTRLESRFLVTQTWLESLLEKWWLHSSHVFPRMTRLQTRHNQWFEIRARVIFTKWACGG